MRRILDPKYNNFVIALQKICLELQSNHWERRSNGWTFKARTFCYPGNTNVKLRLGDKLVEVMGVSDESPDEAIYDLMDKLSAGVVEVTSTVPVKEKKTYRFVEDEGVYKFIEIPDWFTEMFKEAKNHPEVDDVYNYVYDKKKLPEEKIISLKEHFNCCGRCKSAVERMEKIPESDFRSVYEAHMG